MDGGDSDLLFNLGYAYWLERDLPKRHSGTARSRPRRPTDDAAHYVLGVALQMSGNAGEGARERELPGGCRQSTTIGRRHSRTEHGAQGLERVRTELSAPAFRRVEAEIVAAGQRNQQELAAFHIDAGRRASSPSATMRRLRRFAAPSICRHTTRKRTCFWAGCICAADVTWRPWTSSRSRSGAGTRSPPGWRWRRRTSRLPERGRARRELQVVISREPANPDALSGC